MGRAYMRWLPFAPGLLALAIAHRSAFADALPGESASALDRALYAPSMASPLLALLAATGLALHRSGAIERAIRAGQGRAFGLVPLAIGIGLLLWSRQLGFDHLVLPALLLALVGSALAVGGGALLRAVAWPLAALALAVPLPPALLHPIVFRLQLWTVSLVSSLLTLVGRAHEVQGDLIVDAEGVVFQVIEGCSGFKSIVSLMLAAVVYGDLVLRRPGAKGALVLAAIPVAIGMNALRVLGLVVGRVPADSATHTAYGLLAVVAGVIALAVLELAVSRARSHAAPQAAHPVDDVAGPQPPTVPTAPTPRTARLRHVVLIALIVEAATAEGMPRHHWPLVGPALNIETLPETIAGRSARSLRVDAELLGTVSFGHQIYRSYEGDAPDVAPVRVFIGHEDVSRPDRSGWSPKTAIPRSGWLAIDPLASDDAASAEADAQWQRWAIRYPDRRVFVAQRRIGYAPWGQEVCVRWLGLDRLGFLGRRRSPLVVRLELDEHGTSGEQTWMIVRQFEEAVERWSGRTGA